MCAPAASITTVASGVRRACAAKPAARWRSASGCAHATGGPDGSTMSPGRAHHAASLASRASSAT
ncbi:hypothetical protein BURPSS13_C0099 [Burkholderia pseudomallei S13]|nr:hypothetical protein BURPSS13_C0099 [Burkholderia pseudomallei S13]